jgi:hypothetical protein
MPPPAATVFSEILQLIASMAGMRPLIEEELCRSGRVS